MHAESARCLLMKGKSREEEEREREALTDTKKVESEH